MANGEFKLKNILKKLIPEILGNNHRLSQLRKLELKLQSGIFACKIQVFISYSCRIFKAFITHFAE